MRFGIRHRPQGLWNLPDALTSWYTGSEEESLGFTVFLFLISGSLSTPLEESRVALSLVRFTHRLLVLKNLCLQTRGSEVDHRRQARQGLSMV